MLKALIELGADLEEIDVVFETPLMYAISAKTNSLPAMELLLAAGAFPDPIDKFGFTALMHCAMGGRLAPLLLLLAWGAEPLCPVLCREGNETALQYAAGGGHMACVRALLDAGVDVDHGSDRGDTALSFAIAEGRAAAAAELIGLGARWDVPHVQEALQDASEEVRRAVAEATTPKKLP